jgi:hypothetical protein
MFKDYHPMNRTKIAGLIAILIVAIAGVMFLWSKSAEAPIVPPPARGQSAFDGKNATFTIDGNSVTLVNGVSEVPAAPGSASEIITRYFGNDASGDLNGDGLPDTAFLVTQDGGGSGLFYYVVVALKTADGYKTTNAFFIGDRIAPQSTYIPANSQELQVNYAERKPGEPMTAQPSVGVTLTLKVTPAGVLERLSK